MSRNTRLEDLDRYTMLMAKSIIPFTRGNIASIPMFKVLKIVCFHYLNHELGNLLGYRQLVYIDE